MFLFGWGLEFIGWCIGWMLLGIINTIFSIKKIFVVVLWFIIFRLNLTYGWFNDEFQGLVLISFLPIILIIFGYNSTKKED